LSTTQEGGGNWPWANCGLVWLRHQASRAARMSEYRNSGIHPRTSPRPALTGMKAIRKAARPCRVDTRGCVRAFLRQRLTAVLARPSPNRPLWRCKQVAAYGWDRHLQPSRLRGVVQTLPHHSLRGSACAEYSPSPAVYAVVGLLPCRCPPPQSEKIAVRMAIGAQARRIGHGFVSFRARSWPPWEAASCALAPLAVSLSSASFFSE